MHSHPSRREFMAAAVASVALHGVGRAASPATEPAADPFPFYAMDTGLRGPDVPALADKVRLLHDLGYWGIDYTLNHQELPRLLELLDRWQIHLACVYLSPVLEDKPDPRLRDSIRRLNGRPTRIELAIRSRRLQPSDPAGDPLAADLLRQVCDWAADTGPRVSVYPHTGLWTQRVQDGVRLAERTGRRNCGTNFNLVHWCWVKQDRPLETVLRAAAPHLLAVSINGLSGHTIVPLGRGDYDVAGFMRLVQKTGYRGPVGFQGYGIPGRSRDLLAQSMTEWRKMLTEIKRP